MVYLRQTNTTYKFIIFVFVSSIYSNKT